MTASHPEPLAEDDAPERSIAVVAAAMSDTSRVKMLCALMDGRAWTATELSTVADISASTASAHLSKLLTSHLVSCLSQGRHRYFRLAGQDIAQLIEQMMGVSWRRVNPPTTRTPVALRRARTCYDHLAGELAVKIYDALQKKGEIAEDGGTLTAQGMALFSRIGLPLAEKTTRRLSCACLDWSERRFHLGGQAGALLLQYFEQKGWLLRTPGYREVTFTEEGMRGLQTLFAIDDK
ncbi:winged helix-turn-helix domain-containing protein [Yokenella regensburgei]|uniref:ArsR/SmtB family transcription factor n=1 Tax=Yokenella regensburgei TaxID=158877 RepID=UPI003F15B6C6